MTRDIVFYRGPSLLTGDPIVGIVTGLEHASHNAKTGEMAQVWMLRSDMSPIDAIRRNADDAICGDCKLRGDGGFGAVCYVTWWLGPNQVYKKFLAGGYDDARVEPSAAVRGAVLRLGAYGDPAAIPFQTWRRLLRTASGWIGYTHQWRTCDERFKTILMASVDTPREQFEAARAGWRTFRVRGRSDVLLRNEFVCPASNESGHRVTCTDCQLCAGTSSPARNVAIMAHGKPGNLTAFYRNRAEAVSV
jgi:hypothetical protein